MQLIGGDGFLNSIIVIWISAIFIWFIGQLLTSIFWASRCQTWPVTKGRIIKSYPARSQSYSFYAKVKYSYEVNGRQYIGKRVYFGVKGNSKSSANEVVENYPVNLKVNVYYHPRRPRFATLETELPFETYIFLLLIFLFLVITGCATAYSSFF